MPAKASKSSITQKYGNRLTTVLDAHAKDDINYGNRQLPPIRNGVAQLIEMYFAKQEGKDGQDFWRAAGTIVEPTDVINEAGRKEKVKGRQTSMVVMITEETFDEDIIKIQEEMRKLGGPDLFTANKGATIESLCEALVEAAPYFKFETSMSKEDPKKINPKTKKPYPPRLWENWYGNEDMENYTPPEDKTEAQDDTAKAPTGAPSKNGAAAKAPVKPVVKTSAKGPAKAPDKEPEVQYSDTEDLASLRDRAENHDDSEATDKLFAFAAAKGWTEDEIGAANWDELMEMIANEKPADDAGKEDGANVREPKIKETPDYAPLDPKDKKKEKRLKAVNCIVTKVDKKEFSCNLANLADKKKVFTDVPWADLIWDS